MPAVKFRFSDYIKIQNSSYIFQTVSHRKLLNIYHSHEFYELILLLRGNVSHKVNGSDICMKAGDCVILPPKDEHSFTAQSQDMGLVALSVLCDEFSSVSNVFGIKPAALSDVQIFSCAERLTEVKKQSEHCVNAVDDSENKLLLAMLLSHYKASQKSNPINIPSILTNAVAVMNRCENLKDGVSALVRLTNYSYPHLYRLIKHYYGVTPHELVLKIKLEAAYNTLIHSDLAIEQIAESIGFNSVSHFSMIFKEKYNISPAKLRQKYGVMYY